MKKPTWEKTNSGWYHKDDMTCALKDKSSQSMVSRPAASVSSRKLLKIQIWGID